jgi:hypothetical protein
MKNGPQKFRVNGRRGSFRKYLEIKFENTLIP